MSESSDYRHEGVPLQHYIEGMIRDWQKAHASVHEVERLALKEAKNQQDRRLEGLNELRSEVVKDRSDFVRRDVLEAKQDAMAKDIRTNTHTLLTIQSTMAAEMAASKRYTQRTMWGVTLVLSILTVTVNILSVLVT